MLPPAATHGQYITPQVSLALLFYRGAGAGSRGLRNRLHPAIVCAINLARGGEGLPRSHH